MTATERHVQPRRCLTQTNLPVSQRCGFGSEFFPKIEKKSTGASASCKQPTVLAAEEGEKQEEEEALLLD